MTQELIINGLQADTGDLNVVFEYVTNLFGDIGKINLSRSYTISLPKTLRNAEIFDNPGKPAHESAMVRRYFSARYYRNGIDLLGDARAYLLRTSEKGYEIALVWSTMNGLQELSQSKATLNDLKGLPTLRWIGKNGITPDYTGADNAGGAFHAWYNSGLGAIKKPLEINAATHPSMKMSALLDLVLTQAGIPYQVHSETAKNAMAYQAVLAAPSRKPTKQMDAESGTSYDYAAVENGDRTLRLDNAYRTDGWDPVMDQYYNVTIGEETTHHIWVNLQPPADKKTQFEGVDLVIQGYAREGFDANGTEMARIRLMDGAYTFDGDLEVSGFGSYLFLFGSASLPTCSFEKHDQTQPHLRMYKTHKEIIIANDNRFPLEGNLPDIGQWDFIKACMALYGLVPIIRDETLHLYGYDNMLDLANSYDWTRKVDMTQDGAPNDMSYTMDGWAQTNDIVFDESKQELSFDPTLRIVAHDETLKESRDWFKLPFAASNGSDAAHYKAKDNGTFESTDLEPRVFSVSLGMNGGSQLYFTEDMHSAGMKNAYYARVQEVMQKPVKISVNIRLHEIDLATLDLARPVYLGQYGRYYAILKIQTSKTDLCKVELLQLP